MGTSWVAGYRRDGDAGALPDGSLTPFRWAGAEHAGVRHAGVGRRRDRGAAAVGALLAAAELALLAVVAGRDVLALLVP
jgi:hypothetical protein